MSGLSLQGWSLYWHHVSNWPCAGRSSPCPRFSSTVTVFRLGSEPLDVAVVEGQSMMGDSLDGDWGLKLWLRPQYGMSAENASGC